MCSGLVEINNWKDKVIDVQDVEILLRKGIRIDIDIVNIQVEICFSSSSLLMMIIVGKYFCYNCHSDQKFYLPACIIHQWDFSNKHSVSDFASNYLIRLFTDANFDIYHLNSKLFQKSRTLKFVNELRWSLHYLQSYIFTCRLADERG